MNAYLQGEWEFAERWVALLGVRTTRVEYKSKDLFITPANPDDHVHKVAGCIASTMPGRLGSATDVTLISINTGTYTQSVVHGHGEHVGDRVPLMTNGEDLVLVGSTFARSFK